MTRFITVTPNLESDITLGLEQGARYVITGPDGRRAVLNDPSDIDHVGFLDAPPAGLDSADIRESSDLIVEGDGGVHGAFYLGRRPWTMSGLIDTIPRQPGEELLVSAALVNRRIDRLKRATRALRADATLAWTPQDGVDVELAGRLQNLRLTERRPRKFLLAMVAADPRIYARIVQHDAAGGDDDLELRNDGNTPAPWVITLRHNWTNPTITNQTTGEVLSLTIALAAGDTLVIDSRAKTILKNGSNAYSALDFPESDWWDLVAGDNPIAATGKGTTGTAGTWSAEWRSAWV